MKRLVVGITGATGAIYGINRDPHGAGWIFRIASSNPAEADALLDAAGYEGLVGA